MTEKRDLEGLSALVTGATSGIGRAAAQELAARGAEVVVHGRDAARGAAVVDRITAEHGKARFVAADLSDPAQLNELAEQAGTADILVNNAGISWFGPTPELDLMTFDRLFAANVRAPYFLVGALAPKMAARGRGSIINIGSMAGHVGMPGGAAYGATKAALAAMTRSWAAEFSPAGVHRDPGTREDRSRRRHHHHGPARPARRDRQRDRLPRLTPGQLRHRRGLRRRRRPHRHLTPHAAGQGTGRQNLPQRCLRGIPAGCHRSWLLRKECRWAPRASESVTAPWM
jgi:NAD(P)-dependent dehydrogenase (short-subunit alcohol dehydrogenase family)